MRTPKVIAVALISTAVCVPSTYALEPGTISPKITKAYFDTRADYLYEDVDGETNSGFHGRYLNFRIDGSLTDQLTFSWRQRMNKIQPAANDVFSATDWIYLSYRPCQRFSVAAGKQVLLVGGYEYDANPVDIYFASIYWNNIACYQFGASATLHSDDDRHSLTFQICNSPYQPTGSSCYAYNIFWSGNMGWFNTLWSVNMIEYAKGHYVNYISLGNKADLGKLKIEADVMNRATSHRKFWFADYSLIAKVEYAATPWLTVMAKGGKDDISRMYSGGAYEMWPIGGTLSKPFYGGGLEFYPCRGSHDLRLHAMADRHYNIDGQKFFGLNIGVTWRLNIK